MRDRPTRRNLRLAGWDYRSPGPYGITIVTQNREWLFGEVIDGTMRCNPAGEVVANVWRDMEDAFPRISLDAFVVMPNHLHAILWLSNDGPAGNPALGEVIQRFKSVTTAMYSVGVHNQGWTPYDRRVWQQEYYDQIIRNDRELIHARNYIHANPARWANDPDRELEHPPRS